MDDSKTGVVLFDRIFANTIAFLLPGLAVLVGAATVSAPVRAWFGGTSQSPQFTGFLFVIFAALAVGIVLSAFRWWIFESVRNWPRCHGEPLAPRGEPINEVKRREHQAEYEDLRLQHYYYYLAFSNMAVAVIIAIAIWAIGARPPWWRLGAVSIAGILTFHILKLAAIEAIKRYCDRRLRLLGPHASASNVA